jgi:aromatic ring hydroxylase
MPARLGEEYLAGLYDLQSDPAHRDELTFASPSSGDPVGLSFLQIFRLAWDLACSSFAGRQVLYERFFAGDPQGLLAGRFTSYDRGVLVQRVRDLLGRADSPRSVP